MDLRGSSIFSVAKCDSQGSAAPDGSYCYFPIRIIGSLKTSHPLTNVPLSRGEQRGKSGTDGLDCLPTGVLSALYARLSEEGFAEPEVADRLAVVCGGGDLLENARTAHSLGEVVDDNDLEALKRRPGNIDVVRCDHTPRLPPPILILTPIDSLRLEAFVPPLFLLRQLSLLGSSMRHNWSWVA